MISSPGQRGIAALALAVTLAACGSDKATAPTTDSFEEIIADMSAAREEAAGHDQSDRVMALTFAIGALQLGAPVTSGTVVIDDSAEEFNFTSLALALDGVGDSAETTVTFLLAWRHTNADSLLVAFYTPSRAAGDALRSLFASKGFSRDWGADRSAAVARMIRASGSTALAITGDNVLETVGLIVRDSMWASSAALDDAPSGSATISASGGECHGGGGGGGAEAEDSVLFESSTLVSCASQTVNVTGSARLTRVAPDADGESEHSITIPAQSVAGVRVVMESPQ